MKRSFRRAIGVSGVALALMLAAGCGSSSGQQPGTGGAAGSGTGGAAGAGTGGAAGGGGRTPCGAVICNRNQVCIRSVCPNPQLDGGSCPTTYSCVALPTGCQQNATCSCLQALWPKFDCGSVDYGTLKCLKGCA